ncbi:iron complex transport system substrate-binding protein [Sphingomonas sp. PP-F2F-A104-K0414]|uniref:siderophore ABC transporter substrate-binding protein n=1 Tax=Sphingomonas sp. PP-F2F-A104-K0414 TaxID=2135661 RepID=UPI001051ABCD|nr:ABC transporter substrate-binding protein [Sphingomonas sp. PP-F2F-A104-K0414]TCP97582.1 iron complex transport system substrate-binding protein [Sphingomonas sp. PP-F2F-A104-K0414]
MLSSYTLLTKTLVVGLLGATLATGSASAKDVVVPHAKGEIVLHAAPTKAAVFDLASLDILRALGVEAVAGVPQGAEGKSKFPAHLAQYADAKYRNVGTVFDPDIPALTELRPDLIVIGGRSSKAYDALTGIAPTIDMSSSSTDLAALTIANTRTLGRIFHVERRADRRTAAFAALVGRLHAQAGKAGTGLLLFGAGESVTVQAPGDRFGHAYDFIGIRSAIPAVKRSPSASARDVRPAMGSPEASALRDTQQKALATALATNPTWIFVIDRNAATGGEPSTITEKLAANAAVAATSAWKAGRVIYLDPKTWYIVGAGINALSRSAEETLRALQAG